MADAKGSTSPSNVTRRRLLAGAMTAALAPPSIEKSASVTAPSMDRQARPYDLALTLWREWRAAHRATGVLCRKQQRLETRLVKTIGFPRAIVEVGGNLGTTAISSIDELDRLIGGGDETASVRTKAETDLAAHQARWDAADALLGYSSTKQKEASAEEHERRLADALWAAPARSLVGIAAKLDAILQQGEWRQDCAEFPWPQIRSALADLVQISDLREPSMDVVDKRHRCDGDTG